jgi:hypothetical protein
MPTVAPLFLNMEDAEFRASVIFHVSHEKNKGTLLGILELLRAQLLVRRRMLVIVTPIEVLLAYFFTQNRKINIDRYCDLLLCFHFPVTFINNLI